MEESDLLKERLQAITEKRRVQEDIRQKKQELDREKLKLKHLKKTALREQWLLGDSASHNALQQRQKSLLADQQQTRILQSNIHRIESEVESLEREESMISTNERFILLRLKAVEKSPEEIIKEAQQNFIPEPIQSITAPPDQPQSLSLSANGHANPPRQTLFAMEINVAKNLLTGESKVVSTATVTPQELSHCSGVKVYDDGRKCVFALEANRGSHNQGGNVTELSPSEVEQLLRDATQHRRGNHQKNRKGEGHHYNNQHDSHHNGNHDLRNNHWEEDGYFSNPQNHFSDMESCYRSQKDRDSHNDQGYHHRNQQGVGPGFPRQEDDRSIYHQERNGHRNQREVYRANRSSNSVVRSVSKRSQRAIVCPPPRVHDQEVAVPAYHPELCYTPANHIPLSDYISVEEGEELYAYNPPPYRSACDHHRDVKSASAALFYDPGGSERGPSPLYEPDAPYTILDAMDTTEPITAVFLGFQTSQDESDQEYEGSIKAELVVIGDDDDDDDDDDEYVDGELQEEEKPSQSEANGEAWQVDMGPGKRRPMGPGIKKINKNHKACCTVC